jgi:hypothetical protein
LIYTLYASSDLNGWNSGGEIGTVFGQPIDNQDGTETVTVGCPEDVFGGPKGFLKLEASTSK